MRLKIGVLIFGLCLILTSQAMAESAWVLWEKTETLKIADGEQHIFWKILDAFPLYKDCQNLRAKIWQRVKDGANEQKADNSIKKDEVTAIPFFVMKKSENMDWTDVYICLPETVNPNSFERRRD